MSEKANIWTRLEAITQLGILIFAIAALIFSISASNTANEIAQSNLKLSNYNMTIVTYASEANLGIFNYMGNSTTNELSSYGNLSLSLIVISPHAAMFDIGNPQKAVNFTRVNNTYPTGHSGQYAPLLDPQEFYDSHLLVGLAAETPSMSDFFPGPLAPFFQQYKAFVEPGVTQINFTVPLYGLFFLNRQFFNESAQTVPFGMRATLANFNINLNVTDIVTQESSVKSYSGELEVWINANPPFNLNTFY